MWSRPSFLPQEPLEKGSDWKCDRCGKLQPEKWVDERTTKFQEIGAKMSLALTLQDWEDYLKLLSEELHPSKLKFLFTDNDFFSRQIYLPKEISMNSNKHSFSKSGFEH